MKRQIDASYAFSTSMTVQTNLLLYDLMWYSMIQDNMKQIQRILIKHFAEVKWPLVIRAETPLNWSLVKTGKHLLRFVGVL